VSVSLHVVLRCSSELLAKVRYVFDTLCMARGIPIVYISEPPHEGPWLLYGAVKEPYWPLGSCVTLAHCAEAWSFLGNEQEPSAVEIADGLAVVFPQRAAEFDPPLGISFDLVANAFYFLSSWTERYGPAKGRTRHLYANSIYARIGVPLDIVDQYLDRLCNEFGASIAE